MINLLAVAIMFLTDNQTVEFVRTKILRINNWTIPDTPLFRRRQLGLVQEQVPRTNHRDNDVQNVDNVTVENESALVKKNEIALRVQDLEQEPENLKSIETS